MNGVLCLFWLFEICCVRFGMDSVYVVEGGGGVEICIGDIVTLSEDAGKAILKVYEQADENWDKQVKSDDSPLTRADLDANDVICSKLKTLTPNIPIMSEENKQVRCT
mmetsp:Transcript_5372/g.9447  ORF Transcript_5372/g.9447 Transcript_5372/m.9447 type:complete len:108 (-) Transcript_5372:3412-3735(-)